ncbi:hypothetical protein SprV_0100266300 [Sparganum proliferum]
MVVLVMDNGVVSEAFAMINGVKQDCILAPSLFSRMFSAMQTDACRDERPGIRIACRTDGQLLHRRRMDIQSRVSTTTVHELFFADDCVLNATSEGNMQGVMDLFVATFDNYGLTIKTEKTNQSSLRSSAEHRLESSQSPYQHQIEDEQSGHPAHAAVWSADLDSAHEGGAEAQPLPTQQSPTNIEAEVAGPDPGHGRTGTDRTPQHPRRAEANTTELERPPRADGQRAATQGTILWKCRQGFPLTRRSSPVLQGHSEDFLEAPANRSNELERPRLGPTILEPGSEDRRNDLRCQLRNRRLSQTRSSQISTVPTSQRQRSTAPDLPTVPADVQGTYRSYLTSSNQLQHPEDTN